MSAPEPSVPAHQLPLHRETLQDGPSLQKKPLAIRVVPYDPPLLESAPGPAQTTTTTTTGSIYARESFGRHDDDRYGPSSRSSWAFGPRDAFSGGQGSALSSSSSSQISLAESQGEPVSGTRRVAHTSARGPRTAVSNSAALGLPASYASNNIAIYSPSEHEDGSSSSLQRPNSRRRKVVTVHADKTFSLVPHADRGGGDGFKSPPPLSYSTTSLHERLSFDALSEDRPSSPMTTLRDHSLSPSSSSSAQLTDDLITSSPWNYRMVGGLRKVPKTPDLKQKKPLYSQSAESFLDPLPESPGNTPTPSRRLATKALFPSSLSASAKSETTNYKVYGSSSPVRADLESLPPSSSHSNYELLGEPSPTPSSVDLVPSSSPESSENYVLHGEPSPSSSLVTVSRQLRTRHSQESLIVPPLSRGRLGYYRSRSRESLRAASLTSISSVLSQEAVQSLFASPGIAHLQSLPSSRQQDPWAAPSSPTRSQMNAHPHQWSSQLSTVMSESDDGSERDSRSLSLTSALGRRSAGFTSNHSRQLPSGSPSLPQQDDPSRSLSHSLSDSLERPQPVYSRYGQREGTSSTPRLVRDQDEHGDGLTDLHELQQRPSRSLLGGFLSGAAGSERNLHSSASSRANSFNSASLPAWARLYYGSGGGPLVAPSEVALSESNDSRPQSSSQGDHGAGSGYGLRSKYRYRYDDTGFAGAGPSGLPDFDLSRRLGKKTSSVWSPHLQVDRRASRYGMWAPPPGSWSMESGLLGHRNFQVAMFIGGFVFPFAWMLAAVLPLPPQARLGEGDWAISSGRAKMKGPLSLKMGQADNSRYENARWWRSLNRCMSLLGLLIVGAVIALVIIGIKQGWGQASR